MLHFTDAAIDMSTSVFATYTPTIVGIIVGAGFVVTCVCLIVNYRSKLIKRYELCNSFSFIALLRS